MTRFLVAALLPLLLAGCEADVAPASPPSRVDGAVVAMEFRGQRPCVDCDGIESWLQLRRDGAAQRYRLIEIYHGPGQPHRFEDVGEWSTQGDLLRLRSREGGERVYARGPDGMLQARGQRGQSLPALEDESMLPVSLNGGQ